MRTLTWLPHRILNATIEAIEFLDLQIKRVID